MTEFSPRLLAKRLYLKAFNKRNDTKVRSVHASIDASYGKRVLIDYGTVVEADVSIGDYSYVNKNSSIENCSIGKYCSISSGVYVCPFEHNLNALTTHPMSKVADGSPRRRVTIGNDVLISLNCIILEGVTIGNGAVLAAGAVVTKDVGPYEIVGGIPAKHIGWRADLETIDILEQACWWDWDEKLLAQNEDLFEMPLGDAAATICKRGLC